MSSLIACSMTHLPNKDAPDSIDALIFAIAETFTKNKLSNECGSCHCKIQS